MEELDDWMAGSKVSCTGITPRRPCRAGIDNRLAEDFRMDGVKKVMSPEQFDRLASGYERYSVRSGEQTQDDKGMLVELNDALAREAALREQCGGMQMSLDEAAEREAALREELAIIKDECIDHVNLHKAWTKERDDMQRRLTGAEQRNSELVELLEEHQWEWQPYDEHYHRDGGYYCLSCKESKNDGHAKGCAIDAALKPTESGASE